MKKLALIAISLSISSPVLAQTVRCENTIYNMPQLGTTCKVVQPLPPPSPAELVQEGRQKTNGFLEVLVPEMMTNRRRQQAQAAVAANRQTVGKMLTEGRCLDARNFALEQGDFELANHVVAICTER